MFGGVSNAVMVIGQAAPGWLLGHKDRGQKHGNGFIVM